MIANFSLEFQWTRKISCPKDTESLVRNIQEAMLDGKMTTEF